MKAMTVNGQEIENGIMVDVKPYPRIVLGDGGNKRATWIPLGSRDADSIIEQNKHGSFVIREVGIIALNKPDLAVRHLIVAPRGTDNRVLVLWTVSSGYRGSASIEAGTGVRVIGYDHSWHSGRGNLGETAEMLAVLRPGDTLTAEISGRRVQEDQARLTWTGTEFEVIFFSSDADPDAASVGMEYV